jgi:hypothetical protein
MYTPKRGRAVRRRLVAVCMAASREPLEPSPGYHASVILAMQPACSRVKPSQIATVVATFYQ